MCILAHAQILQSAPLDPGEMRLSVLLTWLLILTQKPKKGTRSGQKLVNQFHAPILGRLATPDNYHLALLIEKIP